jgi:hypothetical protein
MRREGTVAVESSRSPSAGSDKVDNNVIRAPYEKQDRKIEIRPEDKSLREVVFKVQQKLRRRIRPRETELVLDLKPLAASGRLGLDLENRFIFDRASVSTALPSGNEFVPTALRAPLPDFSPKTSSIRSLKPLIACGLRKNPPVVRFSVRATFRKSRYCDRSQGLDAEAHRRGIE